MYICICNAIKEKDVCSAVCSGSKSVSDVFSKLGCKPSCGKCVSFMRDNYLPKSEAR